MYHVFTSTNSYYKLERQGGMTLEAGAPLLGFKASWKDGEVKVSPKAAGNVYNSQCQAEQCKGSSLLSFQKVKCLFLISAEKSKIWRHFWYFYHFLMRLNRF